MLVVGGWRLGDVGVCECLRPVCDCSYIAEGSKGWVKVKAVLPGGRSFTILRYRVKCMRE